LYIVILESCMQVNSSQRKARCKWETIVGGWPVQFRLPREGCLANVSEKRKRKLE